MRSPVGFLVTALVLGLASLGLTIATAPPRFFSVDQETLAWCVVAGAPFLLVALRARFANRGNWTDPLSPRVVVELVAVLAFGVIWVLFTAMALGL